MLPLGRTIRLWRIERRLSQEELARKSGIARPNLSMIEQGARDCTVGTLRRVAQALGVRPGMLADGIAPGGARRKRWTRENLDGMARHAAGFPVALSKNEREAAELVRSLVVKKLGSKGIRLTGRRPKTRTKDRDRLLAARSKFSAPELANLVARIEKLSTGLLQGKTRVEQA
jgi:transcriptional regulator with XRE-family HTH domain